MIHDATLAVAQNQQEETGKAADIGILTLPTNFKDSAEHGSTPTTKPSTTIQNKESQDSKPDPLGALIRTVGNTFLRRTLQLPTLRY